MTSHNGMEPRHRSVLITGAAGEIGHGLVKGLRTHDDIRIVATDLKELPDATHSLCDDVHVGDVCDVGLMQQLIAMHEVTEIYHLAALLSTRAEHVPEIAHEVNVGGTFNLLRLAASHSASHGIDVKFILPSTIAIYGLDGPEAKREAGRVREGEFNLPKTMYGANKLYCDISALLRPPLPTSGRRSWFSPHDFRSPRLPGVIAAETKPSEGTSFVPEMIHAAASGTHTTASSVRTPVFHG